MRKIFLRCRNSKGDGNVESKIGNLDRTIDHLILKERRPRKKNLTFPDKLNEIIPFGSFIYE
jgi:hypothetical protein